MAKNEAAITRRQFIELFAPQEHIKQLIWQFDSLSSVWFGIKNGRDLIDFLFCLPYRNGELLHRVAFALLKDTSSQHISNILAYPDNWFANHFNFWQVLFEVDSKKLDAKAQSDLIRSFILWEELENLIIEILYGK